VSEAYKLAVANLERVVSDHKPFCTPRQQATLQFNIFLLKMQPQFTGIEVKEKK
jgi:hypothetical protein